MSYAGRHGGMREQRASYVAAAPPSTVLPESSTHTPRRVSSSAATVRDNQSRRTSLPVKSSSNGDFLSWHCLSRTPWMGSPQHRGVTSPLTASVRLNGSTGSGRRARSSADTTVHHIRETHSLHGGSRPKWSKGSSRLGDLLTASPGLQPPPRVCERALSFNSTTPPQRAYAHSRTKLFHTPEEYSVAQQKRSPSGELRAIAAEPTRMTAQASRATTNGGPNFAHHVQQILEGQQHMQNHIFQQTQQEAASHRMLMTTSPAERQTYGGTRNDYHQSITERDKAIKCLRNFKKEGDAIVHRLCRSLTASERERAHLHSALHGRATEHEQPVTKQPTPQGGRDSEEVAAVACDIQLVNRSRSVTDFLSDRTASDATLSHRLEEQQAVIQELTALLCSSEEILDSMHRRLRKANEQRKQQEHYTAESTRTEQALAEACSRRLQDRYRGDTDMTQALTILQSWAARVPFLESELATERQQLLDAEDAATRMAYEASRMVALLEARLSRRDAARGMALPRMEIDTIQPPQTVGETPVASHDGIPSTQRRAEEADGPAVHIPQVTDVDKFTPERRSATPSSSMSHPERFTPPTHPRMVLSLPLQSLSRKQSTVSTSPGLLSRSTSTPPPSSCRSRSPATARSCSSRRAKNYVGERDEVCCGVQRLKLRSNVLMIPTPEPASLPAANSEMTPKRALRSPSDSSQRLRVQPRAAQS